MSTEYLSSTKIAEILSKPAPSIEQQKIIESPLRNSLVIAGAGSGKTETLVARMLWLILNNLVSPQKILGMTFTRKATAEFQERLSQQLVQFNTNEKTYESFPDIKTYDSFIATIQNDYGELFYEEKSTLIEESILWQEAEKFLLSYKGNIPIPNSVNALTNNFISLYYQVKNKDIKLELAAENLANYLQLLTNLPPGPRQKVELSKDLEKSKLITETKLILLNLLPKFEEVLRGKNQVDFALQLKRVTNLINSNPFIAEDLGKKYDLVLLDEYQDTSISQVKLLKKIFSDRRETVVTAVGDPNQSIYNWRGASFSNIFNFPTDFTNLGLPAEIYNLTISWRNRENILKVANEVATDITGLDHTLLQEINLKPEKLQSGKTDYNGLVQLDYMPTVMEELDTLLSNLENCVGTKAILLRRNNEVHLVKSYLESKGIKYTVNSEINFLNSVECQQVLAYLNLLLNPEDNDSISTLLFGPRWNLPLSDLQQLYYRANELISVEATGTDKKVMGQISILDAVLSPGSSKAYSSTARKIFKILESEFIELSKFKNLPLYDLISKIISLIYLDIEAKLPSWNTTASSNFEVGLNSNLTKLLNLAIEFQNRFNSSLSEFLDYADINSERNTYISSNSDEIADEANCVQILTVHSAKGLEWDNVFIPFLEKNIFPTKGKSTAWHASLDLLPEDNKFLLNSNFDNRKDLQELLDSDKSLAETVHLVEEYRLFYVAVTRAKNNLYLSASKIDFSGKEREKSIFIQQLKDKLNRDNGPVQVKYWVEDDSATAEVIESDSLAVEKTILESKNELNWPYDYQTSYRDKLNKAIRQINIFINNAEIPKSINYDSLIAGLNSLSLQVVSEVTLKNILNLVEFEKDLSTSNLDYTLPKFRLSINQYSRNKLYKKQAKKLVRGSYKTGNKITNFEKWLADNKLAHQISFDSELQTDSELGYLEDIKTNIEIFERSKFSKFKLISLKRKFELLVEDQQLYGIIPNLFSDNESKYYILILVENISNNPINMDYRKTQASFFALAAKNIFSLSELPYLYLYDINTGETKEYTVKELATNIAEIFEDK